MKARRLPSPALATRLLAGGLLLLLACAPAQPAAPAASAPVAPAAPAKADWEVEWDQTLAAAKQEGRVAVYGFASDSARYAGTEPFERRFGITVEYSPGAPQSAQMTEKVRTERAAGQYRADVVMSGTTTFVTGLKPMGALDPIEPFLILPEVKDPKNWRRGLEYVDSQRTGLIMTPFSIAAYIANGRLVNPDQITSYRDLLDPRWKGQIVFHDPRIAGNGQAAWSFFHQHRDLGPEFLRALMAQNPVILRDDRQEMDMLGQGRAAICLGCAEPSADAMIEKGVPLIIVGPNRVREGGQISSGPGNVAVFNRAPHPNAAKVYVNWLLGPEGQTEYAKATSYPSARLDVPNTTSEPWQFPQEGYWPGYTEEALLEQRPLAVAFARELLGE